MKATLREKVGRGKSKTERSGILQSYWLLKWWFQALAFSLFICQSIFPSTKQGIRFSQQKENYNNKEFTHKITWTKKHNDKWFPHTMFFLVCISSARFCLLILLWVFNLTAENKHKCAQREKMHLGNHFPNIITNMSNNIYQMVSFYPSNTHATMLHNLKNWSYGIVAISTRIYIKVEFSKRMSCWINLPIMLKRRNCYFPPGAKDPLKLELLCIYSYFCWLKLYFHPSWSPWACR